MKKDSLGDRIKTYEKTFCNRGVKNMPLIIRVDGKAFHSFTRGMDKPFSNKFIEAMILAAWETAVRMQGFKAAYVQSDEATFAITDYDTHETDGWFDYKLRKIISISASMMSVYFNTHYGGNCISNPQVFDS